MRSGERPTGEIVFIHASAVQGAELLTIGTQALLLVKNDDGRALGGAERDKERERRKWLPAPSEKKVSVVCDQPPGVH